MEKVEISNSILQISIGEKSFGENVILKDLFFNIHKGEFISILGKSGIGKSTLLKLISGIDTSYKGEILFKDFKVTEPTKKISLMFQGHFLLPWLTVEDNIRFFVDGITDDEIVSYLKSVGIANKQKAWPNRLSGGKRTRVGLSSALINNSELLLLDEPFADIDIGVKLDILALLDKIKNSNGTTVLMTTHNIEDALTLSDRILVLGGSPSRIILDTLNDVGDKILLREKITKILTN